MIYDPGIYEVISKVKIRREPRILDNNQVGILDIGKQRQVLSVITDEHNMTWGRISEPDATGSSQWICLYGLNRVYARKVVGDAISLDVRISMLETWARTQGYKG